MMRYIFALLMLCLSANIASAQMASFSDKAYDVAVYKQDGEYYGKIVNGNLQVEELKVPASFDTQTAEYGVVPIRVLGFHAFYSSPKLKRVDLSDASNLELMEQAVFDNCALLETVDFDGANALRLMDAVVFRGCRSLVSIDLSVLPVLETLESHAFEDCSALQSVDLSGQGNLKRFGMQVFSGCSSLSSVDFSGQTQITSIYPNTFSGCKSLRSLDFLKALSGLTFIGDHAFYECEGLTELDFSSFEMLDVIGSYSFYGCKNVQSIEFGDIDKLRVLGNYSFYGCSGVTALDLSKFDELATIGDYSFGNCASLKPSAIKFGRIEKLNAVNSGVFDGIDWSKGGAIKLPKDRKRPWRQSRKITEDTALNTYRR